MAFYCASMALVVGLFYVLFRVFVMKPVSTLYMEISKLEPDPRGAGRKTKPGTPGRFRLMLEQIGLIDRSIAENEKLFRLVFEASGAGYWVWDTADDILTLDEKAFGLLGFDARPPHVWRISDFINLIYQQDRGDFADLMNSDFSENDVILSELRLLTKKNGYRWFFLQGKVIEYTDGRVSRAVGIITDISLKKLAEQEIRYLVRYDKTTGLLNHESFNQMLMRVDADENLPLSVIVLDINGLRLINEQYGFEEGNRTLKMLAEIIRKSTRDPVVSRIGEDEFALLLKGIDELQADGISKTIRGLVREQSCETDISLGYATKTSPEQSINQVIEAANDRMDINKLFSTQSKRNVIITGMSNLLYKKDTVTEEHAQRLFYICSHIGSKLSLNAIQMDNLNLLAIFHDIGKISIPESILLKPARLTQEEFEVVKSHTSIGSSLAEQIPYLTHISREILCHHENFDGSGYPNGLKDGDIPLLARLIRIIDSYDAMITDRPYQKAISRQDAICELKKCSGIQYDPELTVLFIRTIQYI
ncbi:MAG: diguanylate cyclase [Clostridia bacterium]|nr:diguanylate cyclase [Clostridia bacterium]